MKTEKELAQERDYRTASYLVSTLANICAGSPNQIIDLLTGYLWDEEEAGKIKAANMPGYDSEILEERIAEFPNGPTCSLRTPWLAPD